MIARVAVDIPLPHLDRLFDYSIPETMVADVLPGIRVRVRFAGQLRDGYVVDLAETSEVTGKLAPLSKVISSTPVLTSAQIALIRTVADHYAGSFSDVVRLAVPPRHAATEKAAQHPWPVPKIPEQQPRGGLRSFDDGEGFLAALAHRQPVRAYWQVLPRFAVDENGADDWTRGFIQACLATLDSGSGAIMVVPDYKDMVRLRDALAQIIGHGAIAELHSELGTAARYRNYLAVMRGEATVVIGTRPAVYAPVHNLGLICLWDDGDDLYSEPRAPYPHARDVAALRANREGLGLLYSGYARSTEIQRWVERGWLHAIELPAARTRVVSPAVRASADSDIVIERDPQGARSRLPKVVFETIRRGLTQGPVLIQVPRAGYLPVLACQRCRTIVHCSACQGLVRLHRTAEGRRLDCTWCGRILTDWRCPVCRSTELRGPVIGSQRTAEEFGRAFPGVLVRESSAQRVLEQVGEQHALVVATPGAEPPASQGYAAAVLLDASRLLERPDLRAAEESLRRWLNVVSLVRPGRDDGTVCIVGPAEIPTIQALVRLDPASHAARELDDRKAAGYPPAVRFITVDGPIAAIREFTEALDSDDSADLLGPVEFGSPPIVGQEEPTWRLSVRAPLSQGMKLTAAVKAALAVRTASKMEGSLRVRVDPVHL